MKILFAGAGALGSRFGYLLFKNGEDVTFVDTWKDHVENIKNNGLRVIIDDKELGYYNIPTYYPEDAQGKYDVVFVATKSMQLRSMLTKVKHLMHENTKIICILNGLGHVDTLKEFVKEENILIGVTLWTSGLGRPGVLKAYGSGKTEIKQVKEENLEDTKGLIDRLNKAGLNMKYSDNTFQSIWHKAVLNEVTAVAKAEGVEVNQELVENNIENLFDPSTGGLHYPSLYQDMKNGRLTEIDYLNGAISKLGKKHNIQTPVCDTVTLMIHAKEFIRGNK